MKIIGEKRLYFLLLFIIIIAQKSFYPCFIHVAKRFEGRGFLICRVKKSIFLQLVFSILTICRIFLESFCTKISNINGATVAQPATWARAAAGTVRWSPFILWWSPLKTHLFPKFLAMSLRLFLRS